MAKQWCTISWKEKSGDKPRSSNLLVEKINIRFKNYILRDEKEASFWNMTHPKDTVTGNRPFRNSWKTISKVHPFVYITHTSLRRGWKAYAVLGGQIYRIHSYVWIISHLHHISFYNFWCVIQPSYSKLELESEIQKEFQCERN